MDQEADLKKIPLTAVPADRKANEQYCPLF